MKGARVFRWLVVLLLGLLVTSGVALADPWWQDRAVNTQSIWGTVHTSLFVVQLDNRIDWNAGADCEVQSLPDFGPPFHYQRGEAYQSLSCQEWFARVQKAVYSITDGRERWMLWLCWLIDPCAHEVQQ